MLLKIADDKTENPAKLERTGGRSGPAHVAQDTLDEGDGIVGFDPELAQQVD